MGLSVLSRGTFQERLQWAFSLYDVNGDGIITKEEMLDIVTAIYEMMGRYTEPSIDDTTAREHVERVFQVGTRGERERERERERGRERERERHENMIVERVFQVGTRGEREREGEGERERERENGTRT